VLDRRATFNAADRQAQFDAVMQVHALFGDMTTLHDRLQFARKQAESQSATLGVKDVLKKRLSDFAQAAETVRKQIVATKEGGAITGEERIREHTDNLYGALMSYEGRPAPYQIERYQVLKRELDDIAKAFQTLSDQSLPAINAELAKRKLPVIGSAAPAAPQADLSSGEIRHAFALVVGQSTAR